MTRPPVPFSSYLLASMLCFVMVGFTLMPGCNQIKSEGRDAKTAVINCTAQELGTVPGLTLPTLVAVANVVATEKIKCSPNGELDWDCVYTDLIGEGEILGGCAFAKLEAAVPTSSTATALSATPTAPPGSAQFERFRKSVASGAKYHLSDGDH